MFDRIYKNKNSKELKLWAKVAKECLDWKQKSELLNKVFKTDVYSDRNYRGHYSVMFQRMRKEGLLLYKDGGYFSKSYYKLNPDKNCSRDIFNISLDAKLKAIEEL